MGRRRKGEPPRYRLHKQSGQAVVSLPLGGGVYRDVLLGPHDTAESRQEYARVLAEWATNGRAPQQPVASTNDLSVAELILKYWAWAEVYYRDQHGQPGLELDNIRLALRPLRQLYAHATAASFGPLAMRAIQEELAASGLSRGVVNARVNRVRRVFRWAASYQLVPASVCEALRTVPGLKSGRCAAREAAPVTPVSEDHVNAALPFLPTPVRAMVQIQLLTGCRPGEAMAMREADLDMAGPVWAYRPPHHKNKHRGQDRVIFLGPQAQEVVKPFLAAGQCEYLFSPRAYVRDLRRRRADGRKTKRTPSELARQSRAKPRRAPATRYNRRSYRVAVVRACRKAGVPAWTPLQLRHSAATMIRARYGVEAAKVILGHARVETSQIYAEKDLRKAAQIMAEVG